MYILLIDARLYIQLFLLVLSVYVHQCIFLLSLFTVDSYLVFLLFDICTVHCCTSNDNIISPSLNMGHHI